MKGLVTFIVVVWLLAAGWLYLYLNNFATKADVFAWEKNYGIDLPLRMKEMPKTTWEILDIYAEGKAAFTGEIEERKTSAKDEFNKRLSDLKEEAKQAAKDEANERIDNKFWTWK